MFEWVTDVKRQENRLMKVLMHLSCKVGVIAALIGQAYCAPSATAQTSRPRYVPVELTCVDEKAIGYATFQSHNQKVVANKLGLFMTHLRSRNKAYTAQTWRLLRSANGGKSFVTLYEATHATNPPVLETDARNNIYLVRPDFKDGHAYLYRFLAVKDFRDPLITRIPHGAAGKYAMTIDLPRRQLYFFSHNNRLAIVGLDGRIRSSARLLRPGTNAILQYPLLNLDRDGSLHTAWTTQKKGVYLYWDIHHMLSPDGGKTWRHLDGKPLTAPVIADHNGPAMRVSRDDEFDAHTWLSSFIVKAGKVHFMYLAQTKSPRQHYVRYDGATGRREINQQPRFGGKTLEIHSLDGFFASRPGRADTPLYCIGKDKDGHLVCLVSHDGGGSWHDHARSKRSFNAYSIGGCRHVTDDGYIIGSFTDQKGSTLTTQRSSKVYFFRIRTSAGNKARRHKDPSADADKTRR